MKVGVAITLLAATLLLGGCRKPARAGYDSAERSAIRIVGTPDLFAFDAQAAELFARRHPELPAPVVESMLEDQALALLCGGRGLRFPDAVTASQAAVTRAQPRCAEHGVSLTIVPLAVTGHIAVRDPVLVVNADHSARLPGLRAFLSTLRVSKLSPT